MREKFCKDNWKQTDINVDSLWLIQERDKSGKHKNVYHGNFIPQIPNQLIRRYTKTNDTVLELFSGSGTTLFECEKLQRDYIGFDINTNICDYVKQQMTDCKAIKFAINNIDVTDSTKMSYTIDEWMIKNDKKGVDFMIAHPPYLDIVKFTDDSRDLSNISNIDCFLNKLTSAIANGFKYLKTNCYFAISRTCSPARFYVKGVFVLIGEGANVFFFLATIYSNRIMCTCDSRVCGGYFGVKERKCRSKHNYRTKKSREKRHYHS